MPTWVLLITNIDEPPNFIAMSVLSLITPLLSVLLLLGKPGAQLSTGGIDVFAHFPADGGIYFMFLQHL